MNNNNNRIPSQIPSAVTEIPLTPQQLNVELPRLNNRTYKVISRQTLSFDIKYGLEDNLTSAADQAMIRNGFAIDQQDLADMRIMCGGNVPHQEEALQPSFMGNGPYECYGIKWNRN